MGLLLLILGASLVALVVVLVAVHVTKPERFSLGIHTKWGVIGVSVERPFYADRGGDREPPPGALS